MFNNLLHILLRKLRALCDFGNNFAIIVCNSKLFGKPSPKLTSAAAEFPAYSDDFIHSIASFSL